MVQIQDIFGKVIETPKRTRSRSIAVSKPVMSGQNQASAEPVATTLVARLISKSRNPMFTDLKKDESIICRRILKIKGDKKEILKQTDHLLEILPYLSVCQAINFLEGRWLGYESE